MIKFNLTNINRLSFLIIFLSAIHLNVFAQEDVGIGSCTSLYTNGYTSPCAGEAVPFTSTQKSDTHQWSFLPVGHQGVANPAQSSEADVNVIFSGAGDYKVTHTVTSGTCNKTTVRTITIASPIDPSFFLDKDLVKDNQVIVKIDYCLGDTILVTPLGKGGVHIWNFGSGSGYIGTGNEGEKLLWYTTPGIKYITHQVISGSCTTYASKSINVRDVKADFTYPTTCTDNPVCLTSIFNASEAIHLWTTTNGLFEDPIKGPTLADPCINVTLNPAVITHIVTAFGCTDSVTKIVNLNFNPSSDFTFIMPISCTKGIPVEFISSTQGGNHSWDFGDITSGSSNVSTEANPIHTFAQYGTFIVNHFVSDPATGCATNTTDTVFQEGPPDARFSYNGTCVKNPILLTSNTQSGQHTWTIVTSTPLSDPPQVATPPAGISNNFEINVINDGSFRVVHTITYPDNPTCTDTIIKTIHITLKPNPEFEIWNTNVACLNDNPVFFTASPETVNFSHFWNFGDGTFSFDGFEVEHTYNAHGTFKVFHRVQGPNGCFDTLTRFVTIQSPPDPTFTDSGTYCAGSPIVFTPNTKCSDIFWNPDIPQIDNDDTESLYCYHVWTFVGGIPAISTNERETVIYNLPGQYEVKHRIITGTCTSEETKIITINPAPVSTFTIDLTKTSVPPFCVNSQVCFLSTDEANYIHKWDFGSGFVTGTADMCHVFNSAGTFSVKHQVTNSITGCMSESSFDVIIINSPVCCFASYDYVAATIDQIINDPRPVIRIEGELLVPPPLPGQDDDIQLRDKTLIFGPNGKVLIKYRRLRLENCMLTSNESCGLFWQGIQILGIGYTEEVQYEPAGSIIVRNSTIQNALTGIKNYAIEGVYNPVTDGGWVDISGSNFINNNLSIDLVKHTFKIPPTGLYRHYNKIENSIFGEYRNITLQDYHLSTEGGSPTFKYFIRITNEEKVKIKDCEFNFQASRTIENSSVRNTPVGIVVTDKPLLVSGSTFNNLYKGIDITNGGASYDADEAYYAVSHFYFPFTVYQNEFNNCDYGLYTTGDNRHLSVNCNAFMGNTVANWYIDGLVSDQGSCLGSHLLVKPRTNLFKNSPSQADIVFAPTISSNMNYYYVSAGTGATISDLNPSVSSGSLLFSVSKSICSSVTYNAGNSCPAIDPYPLSYYDTLEAVADKNSDFENEIEENTNWLKQNYPNPWSESTTIEYQLASSDKALLRIIDITGRIILEKELSNEGNKVELNKSQIGEGLFIYQLIGDGAVVDAKRMILIRR